MVKVITTEVLNQRVNKGTRATRKGSCGRHGFVCLFCFLVVFFFSDESDFEEGITQLVGRGSSVRVRGKQGGTQGMVETHSLMEMSD